MEGACHRLALTRDGSKLALTSYHMEISIRHAGRMRSEGGELHVHGATGAIPIVIQAAVGTVVDDAVISITSHRTDAKGGSRERA
ncbi:MAG TPA: hypothetical protein VE665_01880 [Hyphomicrobiaceae bacterium]|nr:hypothetical protein [Hyphomicrobiaceae bacterium]